MKKDKEKIEMFDEAIDYEVYADSPKTIITVPWDPKREERELESYRKFLTLMKKIEEEKKETEIDEEPSVLAVPCDRTFIVDKEKSKEFNELKPNPELMKKIEEVSKKLNIKVELEPLNSIGPVLKKVKKH